MRYAVVIEQGESNYSAYVPDLPGCIAAGRTRDEMLDLMQGAIEMHLRTADGTDIEWEIDNTINKVPAMKQN